MTAASAQKIAEDYSRAWMSGDVDKAMSYIADDIVCEAPGGTIEGTSAYRKFLDDFLPILTSATVTKVLGDDTSAAVVYTTDTKFVPGIRADGLRHRRERQDHPRGHRLRPPAPGPGQAPPAVTRTGHPRIPAAVAVTFAVSATARPGSTWRKAPTGSTRSWRTSRRRTPRRTSRRTRRTGSTPPTQSTRWTPPTRWTGSTRWTRCSGSTPRNLSKPCFSPSPHSRRPWLACPSLGSEASRREGAHGLEAGADSRAGVRHGPGQGLLHRTAWLDAAR